MPRVNWPANVVQQQPANPMGIPDPENPGMYVSFLIIDFGGKL
jgi:hypothetical protein